MKRVLITCISALCYIVMNAQATNDIYVYGIDFSKAKVYAAEESVEQFKNAFVNINMLMVTESEKYDFSRVFGRNVEVEIEPILKIISDNDFPALKSLDSSFEQLEYNELVKKYELKQTEGVGVVIVANLLNKPKARAYYRIVIFDIKSREIMYLRGVSGKAGGFGLRNYWAGSIYDVIKKLNLRFI